MCKGNRFYSLPTVGIFLTFFIMLIPHLGIAQNIYYVSSQGDDSKQGTTELSAWKTIAKVNSINFSPGDIVNFKSDQKFSDAILNCQTGVTYTSYGGIGETIIGDSLDNTSTSTTVQIDKEDILLNNLKIYGYKNAQYVLPLQKEVLLLIIV